LLSDQTDLLDFARNRNTNMTNKKAYAWWLKSTYRGLDPPQE